MYLRIMQTMPPSAWLLLDEDASLGGLAAVSELVYLVGERCGSLYEFQDVRRVAAEVLGRLPPRYVLASIGGPIKTASEKSKLQVVHSISDSLDEFFYGKAPSSTSTNAATDSIDIQLLPSIQRAKILIFALCHSLASHGVELPRLATLDERRSSHEDEAFQFWIEHTIARILTVLLIPCRVSKLNSDTSSSGSSEEELFKLQRGCIDALSFAVEVPFVGGDLNEAIASEQAYRSTPSKQAASRPLIQELSSTSPLLQPIKSLKLATSSPMEFPVHQRLTSLHSVGPALRTYLSTGQLPSALHSLVATVVARSRGPKFLDLPLPLSEDGSSFIRSGMRVELVDLVARPAMNGLQGTVVRTATGNEGAIERFAVRLDDDGATNKKRASSMLNIKGSNLKVIKTPADSMSLSNGARALRIVAANTLIAAFQRTDSVATLPTLLRASLPCLLATARSSRGAPSDDASSDAVRAAALQALFVAVYRLPYEAAYRAHDSPCKKLVLDTLFVADSLAASLSALPALASEHAEPVIRETTKEAGVVESRNEVHALEVEEAGLKLLMALAAKVPHLFDRTSALHGASQNHLSSRDALVQAVTLPNTCSGVLGSEGIVGAEDKAAAEKGGRLRFPGIDGPEVLAQAQASVAAVLARHETKKECGNAAVVKQLAMQLLVVLGVN